MIRSCLVLVLLLISTVATAGSIHKWTDKNGKVHFGDRPPAGVKTENVTVKPNVYESTSTERLSSTFASTEDVVLYSAVWCVYCRKARQYFQSTGVPFKEYDVETNPKGKRDYKRLRATGVPVILVGEERINGFSVAAFEHVYRSRR